MLGYVCHDTYRLNHGPVWKTQPFLLSKICMDIHWQDYYGKGNLRKSYWKHGWEKIPNWECLFVHREKGLFLSVYVYDIKLAGKKQNIDPMWKVLNKQVDLEQPASFLDHVYLGCTQCEENTLTRHIFSYLHTGFTVSHMTLAQGVVRIVSSMFHVAVRLDSLRLSTLPLPSHSHLLLHPPDLHLHLPCGSVRREVWPTRPLSQSCSVGMLSRDDKPPDIWDTHGFSGNVFANPPASSSAPHPQESNPWISNVSEHTSPHVMSESHTPVQASEMPVRTVSQKFIHPLWGKIFKELWGRPTTTADFRSSFWQIPPRQQRSLVGR